MELLERLAERNFTAMPADLKRAITQFFSTIDGEQADRKLRKKAVSIRTLIGRMNRS